MKKEFGYVQDREGNAIAGAEIYVRKQSDSTLATLYSDNGVTTTSNPLTTDNDGEYSFYAANDTYKIQTYVEGVQQQEVNNHQHFDLSVITTFGFSLIDDANAAAALTTLGVSAFAQTILDDADAGAVRTTIGAQASDALLASIAGLTFGADNYIYGTGSDTAAVGTITTFGRSLVDDADAATARTTLGLGTIAILDEATAAQYRNNTADKALTTDQVWSAADYVALAESGGNVAVDLNSGLNFSLAMTGNWTLSNPTNTKNGQTGEIIITQDGTGSRTLAYGSNWKFAGGSDPALSTAASSIDVLSYKVVSSTFIIASLSKAFA
jgi:hypothetical protein